MTGKQRHVVKRKSRKCPSCGSSRVVAVIYGMPTQEAFEQAAAGRLFLGGCCVGVDDPQWHCLDCHVDIHRDTTPG